MLVYNVPKIMLPLSQSLTQGTVSSYVSKLCLTYLPTVRSAMATHYLETVFSELCRYLNN